MIISLIGFMGCGKSSVGRRLSELLCCPFMDLDEVIEQQSGRTIPEILVTDGEAAFRQMELAALRSIVINNSCRTIEKQSVPLASSHSIAESPSPKPAAIGFSLQKPTGLFAIPLKRVRECQFHTSASQSQPQISILSLGGGTVMTPECAALIYEQTVCIYLRTSVDTLFTRLANEAAGRPLLADSNVIPSEVEESPSQTDTLRSRIESLLLQRASTYECTAHHIIDTDGQSIEELAEQILKFSLFTE